MKRLLTRVGRIFRFIAMVIILGLQHLLEGRWSSGPREAA
jgi:hypothetical protein